MMLNSPIQPTVNNADGFNLYLYKSEEDADETHNNACFKALASVYRPYHSNNICYVCGRYNAIAPSVPYES